MVFMNAYFCYLLDAMDISSLCVAFFMLGTAVDVGGTLIPSFRHHVMNYGSRGIPPKTAKSTSPADKNKGLLEYVGSIQVPHTWFTHYYIVSVASSIFWASQIITRGWLFRLLVSYSHLNTSESMSVNQVALAWTLMALQGGRRLYESLTLTKASESKMWIGLWGIGIAYYIVIGVSVWIEGIRKSPCTKSLSRKLIVKAVLNATENPLSAVELSKPSLKTFIAVPLFVLASGVQHDCHEHLAMLKKYTLPWHPHFQRIVCPHYTSECLIYIAIAVAAAPKGHLFNRTMLAGFCFVASNLAVTADSTRKWYIEKFGADQLKGRWRMLPYIY